jgi:hypothetical protein
MPVCENPLSEANSADGGCQQGQIWNLTVTKLLGYVTKNYKLHNHGVLLMPISNAEKQARFRKKEELTKFVEQAFRDCQMIITLPRSSSQFIPDDVEAQLRNAAELPAGWTDEDFNAAVRRVENIRLDIIGTGDPIGVDVFDSRINFGSENPEKWVSKEPNPQKRRLEVEKAKRETYALAGHLISAMDISQLQNEDRAAAIMEAVRHVGRGLANSKSDWGSDAMAVCLASANPHYDRPDWFVERLAGWLQHRLDEDVCKALGNRLLNQKEGI